MMYSLIKSILFTLPAERAHYTAMNSFKLICSIPIIGSLIRFTFKYEHPTLKRTSFGIDFRNGVGIAAGFDKDARYIRELDIIGFGYVEVGTVTPLPQVGNPKPRLFRLKKDKALINRMGFNNGGVDAMVARLQKIKNKDIVIGGNIGKNKITPLEEAHMDYLKCFNKLYDYVDYFVVNVSSPNTPGLRSLQDKGPLLKILNTLITARQSMDVKKPILLKIAPDLTTGQIDDIIDIMNDIDIEGIISTNTTINRNNLITSSEETESIGNGGLSGRPLLQRSNDVIQYLKEGLKDDVTIIGVGGIHDGPSAKSKLESGADMVQIYTGFIYEGPFLVKRIKKYLASI